MAHPLVDKISTKLTNLVTLQIVTVVGEVDLTSPKTASGKAARTRINLLDGHVTTELDPSFVGEEYDSVREFHLERERQGHAIVRANIAAIEGLLRLARSLTESSGDATGDGAS